MCYIVFAWQTPLYKCVSIHTAIAFEVLSDIHSILPLAAIFVVILL